MEDWGEYNNRQIFYLSVFETEDWVDQLPTENWLVLAVGEEKNVPLYIKLADACLDKNVVYQCAIGQACELIHDIFDEEVVAKAIEKGVDFDSEDAFEESPMTLWDYDFENGVWFAMNFAYDGDKEIDKIVCIDLTEKPQRQRLFELVEKLKTGWLPSENPKNV